ncbi:MAG: enoyl-CoA hydratase/isomerase family protein [Methanobacteriota archaeon]|nr:MAG: enoyl-CoA hydratase/isomerase family protein [Euryarchaeota archaeon]
MDLTYISLEKKDRVAVAWMNKPKANTYDADLMKDLSRTIDAVRFDDEVDICVLASKLDGIWSAGADINLLASSTPDYKAMFCLDCQEILNKMESTPKLFIAAIDGHCVGGGLEIAMATDVRVASDGAWRVGLPEVTLGVLPGTGGTQRLPRLVGKSRAIDLMATGRMITPKDALEWGLFNRVFPRAKFWEETMAFAKALTYPQHSGRAVGFIKRSVTEGTEMPLYEGLALERELQNRLFAMADAKEGFRAFLEKRAPKFQGK